MRFEPTLLLICGFALAAGCAGTRPDLGPPGSSVPSSSEASTPVPLEIGEVPDTVGAYIVGEVVRFPDPDAGVAYRFGGDSGLKPDVYIYPMGDTRLAAPDALGRAREEGRLLGMAYEIRRRRGLLDRFEIIADSAISITGAHGELEGWHTVVHVVFGEESRESHQHLFAVGEEMLKIRTSFDVGDPAGGELATFVRDLLSGVLVPRSGIRGPVVPVEP